MKKSLWFWLSFITAILLAVYFATRIIMTGLGHGDVSRIKSVSISSDMKSEGLSSVAAAVGIAPGTNVYAVDLADVNARVSRVPGVKASAVRRLPNGNLAIKVNLHKAIALWTNSEHFYPVSADGTIINRPIETRPDNTVVFRGTLPDDISEIAKQAQNISNSISYLEWIEDRRWNIQTSGGITIMLPEQDPSAAISALMVMDKNHNILSKKITTLDMRDPAKILVK